MFGIRMKLWLKAVLLMFFVGTALELASAPAEARVGRGRSSGRSFGGYGARPSTPSSQQAAPSQYGNTNFGSNPPMNANRGSFLRGMAGGLAGGFLGSMLFGGLGHAAGGLGHGGGGGLGLLEMLLLAGLAYFGFRWWKNRQQAATNFAGVSQRYGMSESISGSTNGFQTLGAGQFRALAPVGIDADTASDVFFKIQGAWTRRDLSTVRHLLGQEMLTTLESDLGELKQNQQINRLENITVRRTEVTNSWQEGAAEFSTVRFTANLLDYTVNEKNGQVVEGSDSSPVKFEEDWTFIKAQAGDAWQLAGIVQA